MYKQLFAIQALRHRQNGIEQGLRGQVPEDVHHDIMDRIRPWAQEDWDSVVRSFRTMRVRLRSVYLPSNRHPEAPLLALAVEQLDPEEAPVAVELSAVGGGGSQASESIFPSKASSIPPAQTKGRCREARMTLIQEYIMWLP